MSYAISFVTFFIFMKAHLLRKIIKKKFCEIPITCHIFLTFSCHEYTILRSMILEDIKKTGIDYKRKQDSDGFYTVITAKTDHKSCKSFMLVIQKFPAGISSRKINSKNSKTLYEICSKLTIKTPRWRE